LFWHILADKNNAKADVQRAKKRGGEAAGSAVLSRLGKRKSEVLAAAVPKLSGMFACMPR
jgi:hypothetical protein